MTSGEHEAGAATSAPAAVLADGVLEGVRRAVGAGGSADPAAIAAVVGQLAPVQGSATLLHATRQVEAEIIGAGPLEPFLREPGVTDVLVNGPGPVWVDRGHGLQRTETVVGDEMTLRRLAQRLVAATGRRLDDAAPHADARLPGGIRVHAVLPP
ncbi:MAG TPA: ATPase, T2SS/T4P/T4SS family, partial [Mycobacteriales bacterium]|nr:ATPase, T2SS/T4P/T4SS family [Mycobacteriales bacterium]